MPFQKEIFRAFPEEMTAIISECTTLLLPFSPLKNILKRNFKEAAKVTWVKNS